MRNSVVKYKLYCPAETPKAEHNHEVKILPVHHFKRMY